MVDYNTAGLTNLQIMFKYQLCVAFSVSQELVQIIVQRGGLQVAEKRVRKLSVAVLYKTQRRQTEGASDTK